MKDIVPIALDAIKRNVTRKYGVIAATEGPGLNHKEYMHIWPRDAIFVALELKNFDAKLAENIVKNVMNLPHDNGLFYQRYELNSQPDPHGWCNDDNSRQMDQDALKFVALSYFPKLKVNSKKIRKSYCEFLKRIESKKPSTDVWEQKRGYFFYTTASLIWGLKCAEKVIPRSKNKHKKILNELVKSLDCFYDSKLKSFVKSPSEKIIDLEAVLGINVLFESRIKLLKNKKFLSKVFSTLEAIENELCFEVDGVKIPIRYKGDFWNGEIASSQGNCRPWPMGCAMISQAYCHLSEVAMGINEYMLSAKALRNAKKWLKYARTIPNIDSFPEQIDYDGSIPKFAPRALTWCAAEFLKAERIFYRANSKKRKSKGLYLN